MTFEAEGVEPVLSGRARADAVYRRRDLPDAIPGGLQLGAVAEELGTSEGKVEDLIALGLIRSGPLLARRERRPKRVVLRSDLAAFKAAHVTLEEVAKAWGLPSSEVGGRLAAAGVTPLSGRRRNRCVLYRRDEVDACGAKHADRGPRPAASPRG